MEHSKGISRGFDNKSVTGLYWCSTAAAHQSGDPGSNYGDDSFRISSAYYVSVPEVHFRSQWEDKFSVMERFSMERTPDCGINGIYYPWESLLH